MSFTDTLRLSGSIGGVSATSVVTRTASGRVGEEVALAGAKVGALTTRTDADTGTLTMNAGHGITTGAKISIFWDDGTQRGSRYNVTVGTVSGNSVPIDLGSGDDLPTNTTAVTAAVEQTIDIDFDGDLVEMILSRCSGRAHLRFMDSTTIVQAVDMTAEEPTFWYSNSGFTNPLAGHVISSAVATAADAAGSTLRIGVLYESA